MNIVSRILIFAAFISTQAISSQLTFNIDGKRINFTTLQNVASYWAPTNFDVVTTTPAVAWQPGQFKNLNQTNITLTSQEGKVISIPITIRGIEYVIGSSWEVSSALPEFLPGNISDNNGVLIGNPSGYGNKIYVSKNGFPINPFSSLRPVFEYDEAQLLNVLESSETGNYRASISLPFRYRVKYSDSFLWSFEEKSVTLSVNVDYRSRRITKISISDNNKFDTVYDDGNTKVSGSLDYDIKVEGSMPSGISMRFTKNTYQLKNSESETVIPYLIDCPRCDKVNIVNDEGKLVNERVVVKPLKRSSSLDYQLRLRFNTGFKSTGRYSDNFVVMFSVVI